MSVPNFQGVNIDYKPLPISNDTHVTSEGSSITENEDIAIAAKLMDHLSLIADFKSKIEAIDYLSANAAKLAGNPIYTTANERLLSNIRDLGGIDNKVDFILFMKAIDIVINGYKQMALTTLTGTNND